MKQSYKSIVHFTSNEVDQGLANNLPADTEILNTTTNVLMQGNPNGTPTVSSSSDIYDKVQISTANYTLTPSEFGKIRIFHIESGGTLSTLTASNWPIPTIKEVEIFEIQNHSGVNITFSATVGTGNYAGFVDFDGNPVEDDSYIIKSNQAILVSIDLDGFIQVRAYGSSYTKVEIDSLLNAKQDASTAATDAELLLHTIRVDNPHTTTKAQVGLGNVDNTSDANKPVSTAQATSIATKEPANANIQSHIASIANPHSVTKIQIGLSNADNTSDINKPVSTAQQTALNGKANTSHTHTQTDVTNLVSDLALKAPLASPSFTGTPTAPTAGIGTNNTQLATTAFVLDAVTSSQAGLDWKQSVRAVTTGNITLSGIQTIDGVILVVGNRVLVKDQTIASQNGIYDVASGAWARSSDLNANNEATAGVTTYVEEGLTLATSVWTLVTSGSITLGTTNLIFSRLFNTSGFQQIWDALTTETITGRKIGGLDVYARRVTGTAPASGTDLALISPSTGAASRLIHFEGWINRSSAGQRQPLITVIPDSAFGHASPVYQNSTTGVIFMYLVNAAYNNQAFDIVVYYTK